MRAVVLARTRGPQDPVWHEARRCGFGGSEIAALAGLDPHQSPYTVIARKLGLLPGPEESEAMRWGAVLEPVVANEFARVNNVKVRRVNAVLRHPDYPFALASVDRLVVKPQAVLECKTGSSRRLSDWEEGRIPPQYELQARWYAWVTGLPVAYLAALLGGQRYVQARIERDPEIEEYMLEIAVQYWRLVERRELPDPDGSLSCTEAIREIYAVARPVSVILPEEASPIIEQLRLLRGELAILEREQTELENRLKAMIQDAELGYLPGQNEPVVSWRSQRRMSLDVKRLKEERPEIYEQYVRESSSRTFRLKERNE